MTMAVAAAAVLVAGGAEAAPPHGHMAGAELMPMAKVSLAAARATALKARPGTITDQELEKEAGGSGLRYSFDVTSRGRTFEVGVDARTGAVLENRAEGPNPD
ncbi:MAG: PepSY domain-containing protein [Sphingomonadales bacterium]|nr:PepSY domain-containing protein [Sphingomonadales bacterium]